EVIGISFAGTTKDGQLVGSGPITAGLSKEEFEQLKSRMNPELSQRNGRAYVYVVNDGKSGLYGAVVKEGRRNVIGLGMGTGLAFAYIDGNRNLNTRILSEGGNVVIDMNP